MTSNPGPAAGASGHALLEAAGRQRPIQGSDHYEHSLLLDRLRTTGLFSGTALLGLIGSLLLAAMAVGAGGILVNDPLIDGGSLSWIRYGHGHDLATVGLYAGVAMLVWAWVRLGRDVLAGTATAQQVTVAGVAWAAPLVLSPPLFTRDVYSYLAQGALALRGLDPYLVGPSKLPPGAVADNVHYVWQTTPAPYGPLFIYIAKMINAATGDHLILGVIGMRLVLLSGFAALVFALPRLAHRLGGNPAVALWLVIANPLTVVHLVGGPHNDLLMIGLLAMGTLLVLEHRHAAGIALGTMAMAIKASAGVVLPFLVWIWATRLPGTRRTQLQRASAGSMVVFATVFAGITLVSGVGLDPRAGCPVTHRELDVIAHRCRRSRARRGRPIRSGERPPVHHGLPFAGLRGIRRHPHPAVVACQKRRAAADHQPCIDCVAVGGAARPSHPSVVFQLGSRARRGPAVAATYAGVGGHRLYLAGGVHLPHRRKRLHLVAVPARGGGRVVDRGCLAAAPRSLWTTGARCLDLPGTGGHEMSRELDAAGITEPALRASYTRCRELNAAHGRTYFLATRLLTPAQRPAIHALYGLARYADEIVDDLSDTRPWADRVAELDVLAQHLRDGLAHGHSDHPVLAAPVHAAVRYQIDPQHFVDFMVSMRMDRPVEQGGVAGYRTFDELARYVYGSAAVIGLQVLPVLGTVVPRARAEPHAAALGIAFQITNFLRDVGEDLDRGRVYLPADELASFG